MRRLALVSLLAIASAEAAAQSHIQAGAAAERLSAAGDLGGHGRAAAAGPHRFHSAPAATAIVPDTDPTRSLNTQISQAGNVYTIDGGTTAGTNLFHSFAGFDLAAGDIARWQYSAGDPSILRNVVNRVTGGSPSHLFGTIDSSAIPNADFWFINPAGIVFGAGAVLDVPAAAHFSTASELRFESGPVFAVAAPDGSTLSVANPAAFGFVGGEGAILLAGLDDSFAPGLGPLSLTASDVAIVDSSFFVGSLAMAATGRTAADVAPNGEASASLAGGVFVSNSFVGTESSSAASGAVTVSAGSLAMDGGSSLATFAGVGVDGGAIRVDASEIALLDSGLATFTFGTEAAGDVSVSATNVDLAASIIQSTSSGDGRIGSVSVTATGAVTLTNTSTIAADSVGNADSGGVTVTAGNLAITGGSVISSDAFADGNAGGVVVAVDGQLLMTDGSYISSDSLGSGNGGSVQVSAGGAELFGSSYISSDALDQGQGGSVDVNVAGGLYLEDSFISSDSSGVGNGGRVWVSAAELVIIGGYVSSDTFGSGNGNDVTVDVGYLGMAGGAYISSDSVGTGNGGNVTVTAVDAELFQESYISSDVFNVGTGGTVSVDVANLLLLDGGSAIRSNVGSPFNVSATGDAGDVTVTAGDLAASFGSYIASDVFGEGAGGIVDVGVAGLLSLSSGSYISSDSIGLGTGGEVIVGAGAAELFDSSFISSNALGDGRGGSVVVDVGGQLYVEDSFISSDSSGTGDGGQVSVTAAELVLIGGHVSSDTFGSGNGDDVTVDVGYLGMAGGSYISSDSVGTGNGGNVVVAAGEAELYEESYISSDVFNAGAGGTVTILVADLLRLDGGSAIRSNVGGEFNVFAEGDAGDVVVSAGELALTSGSYISSDVFGLGNGGAVIVNADSASLTDSFISADALGEGEGGLVGVSIGGLLTLANSFISSDSFGSGDAGGVILTAGDAELVSSYISSDALGDGAGGIVTAEVAGELRLRDGSYISSDVGGVGDAGDVLVSADRLDLDGGSYISSDVLFGGSGDAGAVFVEASSSLIMTNGALISSSTSGAGDAGLVFVTGGVGALTDSAILANAFGSGNALAVVIEMEALSLVRSQVVSEASGTGQSGFIEITSDALELLDESSVSTRSFNPFPAGVIVIDAERLLVDGGSTISSENLSALGGAAGTIFIVTSGATISEGGRITTNSVAGPAGDIVFEMTPDSLLILEGRDAPGTIETSSGPGTGGRIIIASPLAIISNGGSILALGESGGANVLIDTQYFIASADRLNRVEVDGVLEFSNAIYDVSAGIVNPDLSVLDASGVLRGQCPAVRASGQVSEFIFREVGPYPAAPPPPDDPDGAALIPATAMMAVGAGACR